MHTVHFRDMGVELVDGNGDGRLVLSCHRVLDSIDQCLYPVVVGKDLSNLAEKAIDD